MKDNQIIFDIDKNGKVKTHFKKQISLTDFLQVTCTAQLAYLQTVVNQAQTSEQQQKIKEELYDLYNAAASTTLNIFAPEIELRPHLTTQAILKAENQLIEEAYNAKHNS